MEFRHGRTSVEALAASRFSLSSLGVLRPQHRRLYHLLAVSARTGRLLERNIKPPALACWGFFRFDGPNLQRVGTARQLHIWIEYPVLLRRVFTKRPRFPYLGKSAGTVQPIKRRQVSRAREEPSEATDLERAAERRRRCSSMVTTPVERALRAQPLAAESRARLVSRDSLTRCVSRGVRQSGRIRPAK